MDQPSGTHRDFGNMLNAKPLSKKPAKKQQKPSPWTKMGGKK